ncbi:MAG TPA: ROK family protein [Chryseosolibacter sp.]|nr:ROK family protein [Chryseosolibacter sp.]
MSVLGLDLGGTKLAIASFSDEGKVLSKDVFPLEQRSGKAVGALIATAVSAYADKADSAVRSIGLSVPGIARARTGTVWAPNISGWEDYPIVAEIREVVGNIPVGIDSDRACCMLGELWQGSARRCRDAIYLAVGTGIGAGVLIDGKILRGAHDIAGSVGWMALDKPFQNKYIQCGCFEYYASGDGIAKLTREYLATDVAYQGFLRSVDNNRLSAHHVFEAYDQGDPIATKVFSECIQYWGMAVANLISIFNPEKIIFGGGVFGPALRFLDAIREEARKWAQPISMTQVTFEPSGLRGDAAIFGAGFLASKLHSR